MSKDKVVRIKPYPIATSIFKSETEPPLLANIMKLTEFGFLFKSEVKHFFKVGSKYTCSFELPSLHYSFREPIKIMKTYQDVGKSLLVEAHFVSLSAENRGRIHDYLRIIKQVAK